MRDSQSLLGATAGVRRASGSRRPTCTRCSARPAKRGLASWSATWSSATRPAAIAELDAALAEGVDVGQLLEQLLGYFRDCMAAAVGCPADTFLHTSAAEHEQLIAAGKQLGLETILAIMQILDHTLSRLRYSTQGRTLAEMALVRIAESGESRRAGRR